jgi:hypothetical protein
MEETPNRLYVGIKVTKALQGDLDSPAPGMKHYFDGASNEYLQVIQLREEKLIGRYITDGFPLANINDVGRNICSIIKLITRGKRIEENEVHIYSC